jgi:hypothetical protein
MEHVAAGLCRGDPLGQLRSEYGERGQNGEKPYAPVRTEDLTVLETRLTQIDDNRRR